MPERPSQARPLAVTLYSKPGCHLCEYAAAALRRLAPEVPLAVDTVDITRDPVVFDQYRYRIPVVMVGETLLDEGKVTEMRLRQELAAHGWLSP